MNINVFSTMFFHIGYSQGEKTIVSTFQKEDFPGIKKKHRIKPSVSRVLQTI